MESVQQQYHESPRDACPMVVDGFGIPDLREMESVCPEQLQDAGSARSKTVQTRGLFNFMELPAEIRVQVNQSAASKPLLA